MDHFRMKTQLGVLVMLVLGCARSEEGSDQIAQTSASTTPSVAVAQQPESLTPPMAKALNGYATHFVQFGANEYAANMDTTTRVESDFNGDALRDVALYGHDTTRELLIVLLSQADTLYRVYPISESRLEPFPSGVTVSLAVHPAGPLQLPGMLREADTPRNLRYPALEVNFGHEGSAIYYWNGTQSVKVATGD